MSLPYIDLPWGLGASSVIVYAAAADLPATAPAGSIAYCTAEDKVYIKKAASWVVII